MDFLKKVFSEPTGEPSFSRIATAFLVLAIIVWGSVVVYISHDMPPHLAEGATLAGALYGANKMSSIFNK